MSLPPRVADVIERLTGKQSGAAVSMGTGDQATVWLDWAVRKDARALLDEDAMHVAFESPQIAHLWVDDFKLAMRMEVPALQYARAAAVILLEQDADPTYVPRSGMLGVDDVTRGARELIKGLRFAEELVVDPLADTLAHLICTATGVDATRSANFDAITVTAASKRDLIDTAKALHRDDPAPVRVARPAATGRGVDLA